MPPRRSSCRSAAASTLVKNAKSVSQSGSVIQTDDECVSCLLQYAYSFLC